MAKKRGNGEGSRPRKRPDGRWEARYTIHTPKGPKRKTVYGRTRQEVAPLAVWGEVRAAVADDLTFRVPAGVYGARAVSTLPLLCHLLDSLRHQQPFRLHTQDPSQLADSLWGRTSVRANPREARSLCAQIAIASRSPNLVPCLKL